MKKVILAALLFGMTSYLGAEPCNAIKIVCYDTAEQMNAALVKYNKQGWALQNVFAWSPGYGRPDRFCVQLLARGNC